MKATYRAMQVTTPGTLDLVERPIPTPGNGEVLIEVEACGICGADASDIEGADPFLQPPRVPGHEVVGHIVATGANVPSIWRLGQRVGVGRLGHMALQYARRMGVAAVGRGQDIAGDALTLGAHLYIDTRSEDATARLKSMGGAQAIVTMIGEAEAISALMPGLAPRGRLVLLGTGKDPLPVSAGHLVVGERSVLGSITGTPYDNEKALGFSVLAGARPRIETMPLEKAFEAYKKMKSGDVKFRMVLPMKDPRQCRTPMQAH